MRLVPLLFLVACAGDGSKNGGLFGGGEDTEDEVDPNLDSDGDTIPDVEEAELGTNPDEVDSDGDGYQDNWEIAESTDPTDDASKIYEGGWPYYPDKDSMTDPGWEGRARRGEPIPRFAFTDQFGEEVDIYDFAYQGKPIVYDISGEWCYYCNELAKVIEGEASYFDAYADQLPWVEGLGELIENGDIYWVTSLDSDWNQSSITPREARQWAEQYPNDHIPVLADENQEMTGWVNVAGWPTLLLVEEDMTVGMKNDDYTKILEEVWSRYGN